MTFDEIAAEHVRREHLRLFDAFFEGASKIECSDALYAEMLRKFRDRIANEIAIVERENEINETRREMAIDDARQTSLPFVPDED